MTTLYTDEDSSRRALIAPWRRRGREAWTPLDVDQMERSDEEQLAFATAQGWVILTSNTDHFTRLNSAWIRQGRTHAGIIILTKQQIDVGLQLRALELMLDSIEEHTWPNRMEFLLQWARRVLETR